MLPRQWGRHTVEEPPCTASGPGDSHATDRRPAFLLLARLELRRQDCRLSARDPFQGAHRISTLRLARVVPFPALRRVGLAYASEPPRCLTTSARQVSACGS